MMSSKLIMVALVLQAGAVDMNSNLTLTAADSGPDFDYLGWKLGPTDARFCGFITNSQRIGGDGNNVDAKDCNNSDSSYRFAGTHGAYPIVKSWEECMEACDDCEKCVGVRRAINRPETCALKQINPVGYDGTMQTEYDGGAGWVNFINIRGMDITNSKGETPYHDDCQAVLAAWTTTTTTATTAEHRRRRATTATTAEAEPAKVKGDPHIVNMKGEHFDIMATGNMLMLEVPHKSTADNLKMAMHADIERLDIVECGPTFIQAVQMTGSWLEHNTVEIRAGSIKASKKTFSIRVNRDKWIQHADFHQENKGIKELGPEATISTTEKQFLLKVNALDITVKQPDRPRAFLDVHVGNIGQLHMEVGGLLGVAEHDEVARVPDKCKNGLGLNRIQQESDQVGVFASASITQHSLSLIAEDYYTPATADTSASEAARSVIPEAKSAASVASTAALLVLSVIWAAGSSL